LTKPTGDFLFRLALSATAPIPREVAGCFEGQAGRYGRVVVSTGPYMIEGMDEVDDSACATIKPARGFDGQTTLSLVRNPDYDPPGGAEGVAGPVRIHGRLHRDGHPRQGPDRPARRRDLGDPAADAGGLHPRPGSPSEVP